MRTRHIVFLIFALFLLSGQANGQTCSATNRDNCAYVSTGAISQIYRIDLTTGVATLIHDGSKQTPPDVPGAVVEGPDKFLYFSDSVNSQIRRFDPFAPVSTSTQASTTIETVTTGATVANPSGLTIDASGNLFANTASPHSGVREITATQGGVTVPITKLALGTLGLATVNATTIVSAANACGLGASGQGLEFRIDGRLLIVCQNADQVRLFDPFNSSTNTLIPSTTPLGRPIGVFQDYNTANILVSDTTTTPANLIRCSGTGTLGFFSSSLTSCLTFVTFADGNDRPAYFYIVSDGTAFLITNQFGALANGKLWKITSAATTCPSPACTLLAQVARGSSFLPFVGVAVGATGRLSDTLPYDTGTNVDNVFSFGPLNFFELGFNTVFSMFTQQIRFQEMYPSDIHFSPTSTQSLAYHGRNGRSGVYALVTVPDSTAYDSYKIYIKHSGEIATQPALLHDTRSLGMQTVVDVLNSPVPDFPDNIIVRYDQPPPGIDEGYSGGGHNFNLYVLADLGPISNALTLTFLTPLSNDPTVITPVNFGKTLAVKFSLTDQFGNTFPGATARLGVALIDSVGDTIVKEPVTSNVNTDNLFRLEKNVYVYNLSTNVLQKGLHTVTVIPDKTSAGKFAPRTALFDLE